MYHILLLLLSVVAVNPNFAASLKSKLRLSSQVREAPPPALKEAVVEDGPSMSRIRSVFRRRPQNTLVEEQRSSVVDTKEDEQERHLKEIAKEARKKEKKEAKKLAKKQEEEARRMDPSSSEEFYYSDSPDSVLDATGNLKENKSYAIGPNDKIKKEYYFNLPQKNPYNYDTVPNKWIEEEPETKALWDEYGSLPGYRLYRQNAKGPLNIAKPAENAAYFGILSPKTIEADRVKAHIENQFLEFKHRIEGTTHLERPHELPTQSHKGLLKKMEDTKNEFINVLENQRRTPYDEGITQAGLVRLQKEFGDILNAAGNNVARTPGLSPELKYNRDVLEFHRKPLDINPKSQGLRHKEVIYNMEQWPLKKAESLLRDDLTKWLNSNEDAMKKIAKSTGIDYDDYYAMVVKAKEQIIKERMKELTAERALRLGYDWTPDIRVRNITNANAGTMIRMDHTNINDLLSSPVVFESLTDAELYGNQEKIVNSMINSNREKIAAHLDVSRNEYIDFLNKRRKKGAEIIYTENPRDNELGSMYRNAYTVQR